MHKISTPDSVLFPLQVPIELPRTVFPTRGLQVDVGTSFVREERLHLPYWTMISAICVEENVSIYLDTLTSESWAIWERPPFSLECKRILRRLLVLHNQVILRWHPSLLLRSFVTQTNLALWIQHTSLSRLSQCHFAAQLGLCTFDTSVPTPHSWDHRCPSALQNGRLFALSVLPEWPIFLLFTLDNCHTGTFASIHHSLSTAAFASEISLLEASEHICAPKCSESTNWTLFSTMWSSWSSGRADSKTLSRGFMSLYDARMLSLFSGFCWVLWFRCLFFQQLGGTLLRSHFTRRFLSVFLVLSIFWVNEINDSRSSSIIERWFFESPFLLLLFLSCFQHVRPNYRPQNNQGLVVAWLSKIGRFLRFYYVSMNLTDVDPRRHSNDRQYGFLASHPDLCQQPWSHRCTSVGLGIILLSERRAELEVRRDDNEWNHLPLTKNHHGLQGRLLFHLLRLLRVSLKFFSEVFTPYRLVQPQSEFSDTTVSSWQFCRSICDWECKLVTPFSALLLPLHWPSEQGFLTRPTFPNPQCLQPQDLLSKFRPRRHPRNVSRYHWLAKLVQPWLVSRRHRGDTHPMHQHGIIGPLFGCPCLEFAQQTRDLECFADSSGIP